MNDEFLKLLTERNEIYTAMTKDIFLSVIRTLCDGIIEYMGSIGEIDNKSQVSWEDIVWFPEEGDFCVVFATVKYQPGSTIMINEKMTTLSEEDAQTYQRMIRVGIPTTIAAGSKEKIIEFLKSQRVRHEQEDFDANPPTDKNELPAAAEFDLEQLSDEQRDALALYLKGMH